MVKFFFHLNRTKRLLHCLILYFSPVVVEVSPNVVVRSGEIVDVTIDEE